MSYKVRTITSFEKEAKRLAKKYPSLKSDLLRLIASLEENPLQGIALGNGFYKSDYQLPVKEKENRVEEER